MMYVCLLGWIGEELQFVTKKVLQASDPHPLCLVWFSMAITVKVVSAELEVCTCMAITVKVVSAELRISCSGS